MQKPVVAPMNSIFLESSRGTNTYIVNGRIAPLADLRSFLEKHYPRKSQIQMTDTDTGKTVSVSCISIREDLNDEEKKIVAVLKEYDEASMMLLGEKTGYTSEELLVHMSILEMK